MQPLSRFHENFRWDGIPVLEYKQEGSHFRGVTRQVLFGEESGLPVELRYFEVQPDGYTTLERHEHPHAVLILRGMGRMLVGTEVFSVAPFDRVQVPPLAWHQIRAGARTPLGFLCLVDAERDRPARPDASELAALRAAPEVAAFLRV